MNRGRLCGYLVPAIAACALVLPATAAAQTVSATTAAGDLRIQVGQSAALPDDFPGDVWLPEGQALERVEQAGGKTMLTFDMAGADASVAAGYDERMRAAGWAPARVVQPGNGSARAWEKDGRAVVAAFDGNDAGGTRVRLQLLARR